jgi:tRNA dimethylallyltransferase
LHAELARIDPTAAARIEPADRQRIQRALEVYYLTGKPISHLQRGTSAETGIDYFTIGLLPADRTMLYRRLDQRLHVMLERGFLEEVRAVMAMPGMSLHCPSIRAVGYRQLWRHLAGEHELAEAVSLARLATRRLAKRQLTWLRAQPPDVVLEPLAGDTLAGALQSIGNSGVVAA